MSRTHPQGYGTPVAGSKTELRGKQAHARISGEIVQLCDIIHGEGDDCAGGSDAVGCKQITFGELFRIYVVVSNKLVGVLLRARKHGIVAFEGETLFQGRDDKVVVTLLKTPQEVRTMQQGKQHQHGGRDDDFQWGKCMKQE